MVIALISALLLRNDPAESGREPFGQKPRLLSGENAFREKSGNARVLVHLGLVHFLFGITYMVYGTFIVTTMVEELFSRSPGGIVLGRADHYGRRGK